MQILKISKILKISQVPIDIPRNTCIDVQISSEQGSSDHARQILCIPYQLLSTNNGRDISLIHCGKERKLHEYYHRISKIVLRKKLRNKLPNQTIGK